MKNRIVVEISNGVVMKNVASHNVEIVIINNDVQAIIRSYPAVDEAYCDSVCEMAQAFQDAGLSSEFETRIELLKKQRKDAKKRT